MTARGLQSVATCLVGLLVVTSSLAAQAESLRVKRQTGGQQRPQDPNPLSASIGLNAQGGGGQATSLSLTSALSSSTQVGGGGTQVGADLGSSQVAPAPQRPKAPRRRPPQTSATLEPANPMLDEEEDALQTMRPVRRRPARPQPQRRPSRYDEETAPVGDEDEDCHDSDDYDYGNLFHEPMHHIKSMMGHVFSQMRGMQSGDFGNFPAGGRGNMAAASALSNDDGYSRTSSIVNSNGRTRGLVSETRNGRTETRRFGNDEDDDEE